MSYEKLVHSQKEQRMVEVLYDVNMEYSGELNRGATP